MAKPKSQKMCRECGQRKALFRQPSTGKYVWSEDHDLCTRCYDSRHNSDRARQLARREAREAQQGQFQSEAA